MNVFNIDKVIYHIATLCSYQQLILLSQINKQFNNICNNVIDHYDNDALLKEFNIHILNTCVSSLINNIF